MKLSKLYSSCYWTLWSRWCRRPWTAMAKMGRLRCMLVLVLVSFGGGQLYLTFVRHSHLPLPKQLPQADFTPSVRRLSPAHEKAPLNTLERDLNEQPQANLHRIRSALKLDGHGRRPPAAGADPGRTLPVPGSKCTMLLPEVDMESVMKVNSREEIHNSDRFQPRLDEDGVVIIVQVHNRPVEMELLIESLRQLRYINETLVIFSHDLIKREIHDMVCAVDFAPVLQLWYPYSVQLHPFSFPGDSPYDCGRNMTREQARLARCTNWKHPDSYGHYREGKFCQLKHHWLWKLEYVINEVRALEKFQGTFLRLDEDYYLLPDAIHLMREVRRLLPSHCPECLMGIIGEREDFFSEDYRPGPTKVITQYWKADLGRGMAFTKTFWDTFKGCAEYFCTWDDYNWDLALQYMSTKCQKPGFSVWKPVAGRLFHIGLCSGFHRNNKSCKLSRVYGNVRRILDKKSQYFFPPISNIAMKDQRLNSKNKKEAFFFNGGWADLRDHAFCRSLFERTSVQKESLHKLAGRA